MVVTLAPSHETASTVQDFMARPSRCTTQAPHWLVSQPTCVPVRRRFSRRNCTSSVRGSMSALTLLPLTVIDTVTVPAAAAGPPLAADEPPSASFLRKNMRRLLYPAEQMRRGLFWIVIVLDYATDVARAQSDRRFMGRRPRHVSVMAAEAGCRTHGRCRIHPEYLTRTPHFACCGPLQS